MKLGEIRSVIDIIRDASKKELIIVSLFLLPILLGGWSIFISSIGYFDQYDLWKLKFIVLIFMIYLVGLIFVRWTESSVEKLNRAKLHVKHRLEQRPGHRASFMAIREEVNKDYSNKFLQELIEKNPAIFRTVKVKSSLGVLEGITLVVNEELVENQTSATSKLQAE